MRLGYLYNRILLAGISPLLALLIHSCASTGISIGEQKNSLPFMGKELIEEVHTVAVPPFYGNQDNWKETIQEILSSVKRVSVIAPSKVDSAIKSSRKDLPALGVDERFDLMGRLGRSLHADAVINGLIISKDNHNEIILQLISSKDSKILWWQAVEFRGDNPSPSDQRELLTKMLSPLLAHIGKGEKSKSDKRPDKGPKPSATPDDVGPM